MPQCQKYSQGPKTLVMNNFAELRERAGLSKAEAATRLGKSPSTIYRWERGSTPAPKMAMDAIKAAAELANRPADSQTPFFEFIDLFAGIGGLRKGFEPAGKCVFTCEWDKHSRSTYLANFECDHPIAGDIRDLDLKGDVPPHDVLLAGFPCQPFSIAGVSKKNSLGRPHGFKCDTQGTLFFEVAGVIEAHRPKAIVLENVKNLTSHDKGNTFRVICQTLDELGYDISHRVINSKGWVPQQRQRIFIVGFRKDMRVTDFSLDDLAVPDPNDGPKMQAVLHSQDDLFKDESYVDPRSGKVLAKYTLSKKLWDYLQAYAAKHAAKGNGFGFGAVGPNDVARTLSARYYKDGSEILVKQRGKRPRRLTPRECARLMGFDDLDDKPFEIPVSDTQAYKQFGNAVVVPVVKAIAEHMNPTLRELVTRYGKESDRPRPDSRQRNLFPVDTVAERGYAYA